MKKSFLLGIVVATLLLVAGCSSNNGYQNVQARADLIQENWLGYFKMNPKTWTTVADPWYFTNYPSDFNQYDTNAAPNNAVTAAQVRVPNFTKIKVEGAYTVQLYGSGQSSATVLGSNEQVRHTQIDVQGDVLYVHPSDSKEKCDMKNVIIRVGVRDLQYLYHAGTGLIEGKNIRSHSLIVKSLSSGNILLAGEMNLTNVVQGGTGTISIIGVYAPVVEADVLGNGNVNLSGRIGIRCILKHGCGCLNILGADSDSLHVAANNGCTTVSGNVNLQSVNTTGTARVYIYWVKSGNININVHDYSRLGLAGCAQNLNIGVDGNARFEGKCLHAPVVYVKTAGNGHANVSPDRKLFADAVDYSSIYFFSSPYPVSRYYHGKGIILPIAGGACPLYPPSYVYVRAIPSVKPRRACYRAPRKVCHVYHRAHPTLKPRKTKEIIETTITTTTTSTKAPTPKPPRIPHITPPADATYHGEQPYSGSTSTTTTTTK